MQSSDLFLDILLVTTAAFLGGIVAHYLRLPTIIGFLAAGLAIGPHSPGPSASVEDIERVADIGVILLMFGIGVVILSYIQSMRVGNQGGLKSFIYGQAAGMSVADAKLIGVIAAVGVVAAVLLLKECRTVCFDEQFARVTGLPVSVIDFLMMSLVVGVTVVGL